MARRKDSGLDLIAALPWPVGIVVGLGAFFVMRYGVEWYFAHQHNPFLDAFGKGASGAIAPLAWILLALCWIAALVSFLKRRKRRKLLDCQSGLESIRELHWREFEMLVGEAFRRQGYAVEETGLGGADGGIDLILRRDGRTTLVQCKHWKRRQVDVKTVREMYGLLAHHRAKAGTIVCTGGYTPDAARFAHNKPIELITGDALARIVEAPRQALAVNPRVEPTHHEPSKEAIAGATLCPICSSAMASRRNRKDGTTFLGCTRYPRCRGTRPVERTS